MTPKIKKIHLGGKNFIVSNHKYTYTPNYDAFYSYVMWDQYKVAYTCEVIGSLPASITLCRTYIYCKHDVKDMRDGSGIGLFT